VANHRSAEKRGRQSLKRRDRNRHVKGRVKTVVKDVRKALESGGSDEANQKLRAAESELRKAASKGTIPKTRASRQVARLSRAVARLSSS
jgi:small subunit ribosomal protein S20